MLEPMALSQPIDVYKIGSTVLPKIVREIVIASKGLKHLDDLF